MQKRTLVWLCRLTAAILIIIMLAGCGGGGSSSSLVGSRSGTTGANVSGSPSGDSPEQPPSPPVYTDPTPGGPGLDAPPPPPPEEV